METSKPVQEGQIGSVDGSGAHVPITADQVVCIACYVNNVVIFFTVT